MKTTLDIGKKSFDEMVRLSEQGLEGLVIMGAGEPHNKWVEGITDMLQSQHIAEKGAFTDVFILTGNIKGENGRTDLVMMFDSKKMKIGKLAMWRIRVGSISWVSDFINNYRQDYI